MPRFMVLVCGRGFRLELEEKGIVSQRRMGFHVWRFVDAADEDDAEHRAIESVRADPRLHESWHACTDSPPSLVVERIERVPWFRRRVRRGPGFIFFPDDELGGSEGRMPI